MKTKNVIMTLIALSTVASIGLVVANDTTEPTNTTIEPTPLTEPSITILPTGANEPDKIIKSDKTITVINPTCSCGRAGHYNKTNKTIIYKNIDPFDKQQRTNGLIYNKKNVADGELTGRYSDGDFCLYCGDEKMSTKTGSLEKL